MQTLDNITADSKQKHVIITPDGGAITIQIEYKPQQNGWFFTSIEYGDFTLKGIRICTSPNLLHQYINQIPFGFMVTSKENFEPTQQEDFFQKNSVMYLLSEEECQNYLDYLNNG